MSVVHHAVWVAVWLAQEKYLQLVAAGAGVDDVRLHVRLAHSATL